MIWQTIEHKRLCRHQADDGRPAGWHGPHEARVSELQMHEQIDFCMHMPCTGQHCRIRYA